MASHAGSTSNSPTHQHAAPASSAAPAPPPPGSTATNSPGTSTTNPAAGSSSSAPSTATGANASGTTAAGGSAWTEPPWCGWIETTGDALIILEAARRGLIPRVTRRLVDAERKMITSGSVFVFDEDESGIKRWTDGFFWSPSRILGNFLLYRETDKRGAAHRGRGSVRGDELEGPGSLLVNETHEQHLGGREPQSLSRPKGESSTLGLDKHRERTLVGSLTNSYKFKPDGMMKKTFSLAIGGVSQHLISYYKVEDVEQGRLRTPSSLPELAALDISPEYLDKTHFRNPPKVEYDVDGVPRYRGEADEADPPPRSAGPASASHHGHSHHHQSHGHSATPVSATSLSVSQPLLLEESGDASGAGRNRAGKSGVRYDPYSGSTSAGGSAPKRPRKKGSGGHSSGESAPALSPTTPTSTATLSSGASPPTTANSYGSTHMDPAHHHHHAQHHHAYATAPAPAAAYGGYYPRPTMSYGYAPAPTAYVGATGNEAGGTTAEGHLTASPSPTATNTAPSYSSAGAYGTTEGSAAGPASAPAPYMYYPAATGGYGAPSAGAYGSAGGMGWGYAAHAPAYGSGPQGAGGAVGSASGGGRVGKVEEEEVHMGAGGNGAQQAAGAVGADDA